MKLFDRKKRKVFPSVAEQDAVIAYLKQCSETDLVARFKADKEFRYMADSVFSCWRIRNQCRTIRAARGYTQEQLAERAKVSYATINRLENIYAPMEMSVGTLIKIAHALDVAFICRFQSWGEAIRDIIDTMAGKISLNIPAFKDDPAFQEGQTNDPNH